MRKKYFILQMVESGLNKRVNSEFIENVKNCKQGGKTYFLPCDRNNTLKSKWQYLFERIEPLS